MDWIYLRLTQLVMRYEHHKLHVSFLAHERNEPAKRAGKKNKLLNIKERVPITQVIKHRELAHKRSVKRVKCQV